MRIGAKENVVRSKVLLVVLLLLTSTVVLGTVPRLNKTGEQEKQKLVEQAADQFIRRFYETFDVGAALDEIAVSEAIQGLRKAHPPQFGWIKRRLIETIDDATANRLYRAVTNGYYLGTVYSIGLNDTGLRDVSDAIPVKIKDYLQQTHWLKGFIGGTADDRTGPATLQELLQYISEWEHLSELYRESLLLGVFDSSSYQKKVALFNKNREGQPFEILKGSEGFASYGIEKNVEVYVVRRDVFTLYFVEKNGEFKVFKVGIRE